MGSDIRRFILGFFVKAAPLGFFGSNEPFEFKTCTKILICFSYNLLLLFWGMYALTHSFKPEVNENFLKYVIM